MSYLLLAEKEHHLLLKNEERKPAREVNTTELSTTETPRQQEVRAAAAEPAISLQIQG